MAINCLICTLFNEIEIYRRRWKLARLMKAGRNGCIVMEDRRAGFFSLYFQVLGALEVCQILSAKLVLRFHRATYQHSATGDIGWWFNYFEQNEFISPYSDASPKFQVTTNILQYKLTHLGSRLGRNRAHWWTRQLRPKQHISRAVNVFIKRHFGKKPVIGIHYRGTDKVTGQTKEAERVDAKVLAELLTLLPLECQFFVATDEWSFLRLLHERLPSGRLITIPAQRSTDGNPVHLTDHCRDLGKEALMDALLLASTNFLLRTDSNLSLASTCMNPKLPALNLTTQTRTVTKNPKWIASNIIRTLTQAQT